MTGEVLVRFDIGGGVKVHNLAKMCAGTKFRARGAPAKNAILWTLLFTPHARRVKTPANRPSCLLHEGKLKGSKEKGASSVICDAQ